MAKTIEEIADFMYKQIKEATEVGKKLKPGDLTKAAIRAFGDEGVDKKMGKQAIKLIVTDGRCVYTYFGGSYLELPHREAAAND